MPESINLLKIKETAEQVPGVLGIHHLHVWAISTTENALTAHVVIGENSTMQEMQNIKQQLSHELKQLNIQHVTLETESMAAGCETTE